MKAARRGPFVTPVCKKNNATGAAAIHTAGSPSHIIAKSPEPERRLLGRGVTSSAPTGKCICTRPKVIVFCHGCGYFRQGRKKMQCPVHMAVHFLYDISTCEKCHTSFYLHEYEL